MTPNEWPRGADGGPHPLESMGLTPDDARREIKDALVLGRRRRGDQLKQRFVETLAACDETEDLEMGVAIITLGALAAMGASGIAAALLITAFEELQKSAALSPFARRHEA